MSRKNKLRKTISITIPNNVSYTFDDNRVNDNVLYAGNHLIKAKTTVSGSYTIRNGTKTIAGDAFYGCSSLSSITIPDSVTSIGYNAFSGCSKLASITYNGTIDQWISISGYYNIYETVVCTDGEYK